MILFLFSGQVVFSQNKTNKTKGVSIGLIIAPQFSNWSYNNNKEYQSAVDLMDSIFTTKNGGSLGFVAEFQLNNKSSLKTGLTTSIYPFETITMEANVEDPLIPCGKYSLAGSDYFIDLPFSYKHSLYKTTRINLFLGAGIINKFLFYTRTKSYSICNGEKDLMSKSGNVVKYFNYFIAASIEAGIEILITERFNVGFFPSFEYSVLNIKKDREITKKYYQVGLNLSAVWKL